MRAITGLALLWFVVWLAAVVGIIWVAIHFAVKYW